MHKTSFTIFGQYTASFYDIDIYLTVYDRAVKDLERKGLLVGVPLETYNFILKFCLLPVSRSLAKPIRIKSSFMHMRS